MLSTSKRDATFYLTIIFLAVGYFSYSIDRYAFAFLVPEIAKAFSMPLTLSGLLGTIFLWGQLVASTPAGLFMGKYGYKYTLSIGIGIATLGILLTGIAQDTTLVVLARIVTGVGEGFWNTAIVLTLATLFKGHKGSGVGLSQDFFGAGLFFGPFLGGYILSTTGDWRQVFYTFALIGTLGTIMVVFGVRRKRIDEFKVAESLDAPSPRISRSAVLRDWRIYVPVVLFSLYEIGFWSWTISVSTYLKGLGFDPATAGFLAGADGLAILALSWLAGYYGDKFGRNTAFVTGGLLQGIVGIIAYAFGGSFWVFLVEALVFGFFTIMIYINIFAYIAQTFDRVTASFVTGVTFTVGLIFAGYIGFLMFDMKALYGWPVAATALIGVSSFVLAILGGVLGKTSKPIPIIPRQEH
jgi:MFS family permease